MEFGAIWRAFAEMAGSAAVSALWQGLAVAVGLAICLRLTPRISARDRFRVWVAGFIVLAVLPFLPGVLSWIGSWFAQGAASAGIAGSVPGTVAGRPWLDLDARWSFVIAGFWVAGSLLRTIDLGVHVVRLRRLWKRAKPLRSLPEEVGGRKVVVCATPDLDRPSVIGFFAPRILIPEWLLGRLSDEELEQVVLHEVEHLRRRDDWINLAQKLCLMVFPLNPALAWIERRLCREREMACDEAVVRRTRAPRAYAACLASLAERGLQRRMEALSLGAWQRRPELVVRVQRILRRGPGLHPAVARTLLGVVGCGLVFGSVELARCPQLVGFAAPSAAEATGAAAPAMTGFRAYNAVAHVPSRAELANGAGKVQNRGSIQWFPTLATEKSRKDGARKGLVGGSPALATEGNRKDGARKDLVGELASRESHAPAGAVPQQVVVFTAWEQVEDAGPAANSMTGDEAGDAVLNPSVPAAQTRVVREYTVTRVILSVYPAAGAPHSNPSANPGRAETGAAKTFPMTPLPAAIPVRDGWLVIQL